MLLTKPEHRMSKKRELLQEKHTVQIQRLSHEGRGVALYHDRTVFIAGALPEEEVEFHYLRLQNKIAEGVVEKVITPATNRVTPPCPVFLTCGGCQLQHLNTKEQLLFKERIFKEQLQHIGKVQPKAWVSPVQIDTLHYRCKARLGVRYVKAKERVLVGFREMNGRYLTDTQVCPILTKPLSDKLGLIADIIGKLSQPETIPQIEVASNTDTMALIFRHMKAFTPEDIALLKSLGEEENFWIYLQPGDESTTHKIYPEDNISLLSYQHPDHNITLQFSPHDFTQVNQSINRALVNTAIEALALTSEDTLLDLFCGLGNFSLPCARYVKHVTGIEGSLAMVERAYKNAELNAIKNADFYAADLFSDCSHFAWYKKTYTKLLLDPPRSGALELVKTIEQFSPSRIVYISCNPATFARDANILVHEKGYTLLRVGVFDMFPHTSHMESLAVFIKDN